MKKGQIWINTRVEYQWNPKTQQYDEISKEGYWADADSVAYAHNAANIDQDSFRFYDAAGTNAYSDTPLAALNTGISLGPATGVYVGFLIQEDNGGSSNNFAAQLEYQLNGGGWNNVTGSSAVVRAYPAATTADGTTAASVLGTGTDTSPTGAYDDVDGLTGTISFAGNDEANFFFAVELVNGDVANSDSVQLRVAGCNTYTNTATITAVVVANDALTADNVQSQPQVEAGTIGQTHALPSDSVQSATQVSDIALSQVWMLTADDIQSVTQVSDIALLEVTPVFADDVQAQAQVSDITLAHIYNLAADDIQAQPQVADVTANQSWMLAADDIQSQPQVSTTSVQEVTPVLADDIQSDTQVSDIALAHIYNLTADDTQAEGQVSDVALAHIHNLAADDIESTTQVSDIALVEIGSDACLADDIQSAVEVTAATLVQDHTLTADNVESQSQVSAASSGNPVDPLLGDDVQAATEVSVVTLSQIFNLFADDVQTGETGFPPGNWYDLDDPVTIAQIADEVASRFSFTNGRVDADITGSTGLTEIKQHVTGSVPSPPSNGAIAQEIVRILGKPKLYDKELKAIEQRLIKLAKPAPANTDTAEIKQMLRMLMAQMDQPENDQAVMDEMQKLYAMLDSLPKEIPNPMDYTGQFNKVMAAVDKASQSVKQEGESTRKAIKAIPQPDLSALATADELKALTSLAKKLNNYDDTDLRDSIDDLINQLSRKQAQVMTALDRKVDLILDNQYENI